MKSTDLKFFAWEEKGGQVKEKTFLFLLPLHQATAILQYSVAKDGSIQGQLCPVTLSYISASSTFRQDNT